MIASRIAGIKKLTFLQRFYIINLLSGKAGVQYGYEESGHGRF